MPRTSFCINCDYYQEVEPERLQVPEPGDPGAPMVLRDHKSMGLCHFEPTYRQGQTEGDGFCSNYVPEDR